MSADPAFKIESGIPAPTSTRRAKYPWRAMSVGDSFFVVGKLCSSMSATAANAGQRTGFRFVTRAEGDGVRVWRVA